MLLSNNNMRQSKLFKITLGVSLMAVLSSFTNDAQSELPKPPEPKTPSHTTQPLEDELINRHITSRHEQAKNRAAKLRAKTKAQREKRKAEIANRRAAHQAKINKDRTRHMEFKTKLLSMLKTDGIISTAEDRVKITYQDDDILANEVNVSERFDKKYGALWDHYNRVRTPESYILIEPHTYEIREVKATGQNYHFQMQTG